MRVSAVGVAALAALLFIAYTPGTVRAAGTPPLRERFAPGQSVAYTYTVTATITSKAAVAIPPQTTIDHLLLRTQIARLLPSGAGCGNLLLRHLTAQGWRNRGYPDVTRAVCLSPTGGLTPPYAVGDDVGYLCDPQATTAALPGRAPSVGLSWRGAASLACIDAVFGYREVAPGSLPMTFRVISVRAAQGHTLVRIVGNGALSRVGRALTDDVNHTYNPSSITIRLHTDDTFDATAGRWIAQHAALDGADLVRDGYDSGIRDDSSLHVVMDGSPATSGLTLPDPGDLLPWLTAGLLLASAVTVAFLLRTGGLTATHA